MKPLVIHRKLNRATVAHVLKERGKDLTAVVLFGRVVIMWDAPDRGRKVDFQ